MSVQSKAAEQFARQLIKLSVVDGSVSPSQVAGVLEYVEAHKPANAVMVLNAYKRLVSAELSRSAAIIEHAGPISDAIQKSIAATLTAKFKRTITTTVKSNPDLLAGIRVRLGDDIFESSLSSQLTSLAENV
ncbi:MAG: F0F1 ATP synthase subunit delta [Verrucomicrobia bacterium]|nr:MAG: F0F1 ATP synthase subunit delta [Verrucomicrobiota bacterium]